MADQHLLEPTVNEWLAWHRVLRAYVAELLRQPARRAEGGAAVAGLHIWHQPAAAAPGACHTRHDRLGCRRHRRVVAPLPFATQFEGWSGARG